MIRFPNGYIMEPSEPENAFLVYGELNSSGYIAKGFRLHVPNLSNAGWSQKNELSLHLQSYLSRFDSEKRLQFCYRKDSNYRRILAKYEQDTEELSDVPFIQKFRRQIAAEFRREMENHKLWREYLTVYIARPMKDFIHGALDVNSKNEIALFQKRVANYFESEYLLLRGAFSFQIDKLDSVQLFADFFNSVNKSLASKELDYRKMFSPNFCDIYLNEFEEQDHSGKDRSEEGVLERGYGMYGDGMYHNILVMRQLPSFDLTPFYGNIILETNITNISVTVNLRPLNKIKTIEKILE